MNSRLRNHRTNSTTIAAANSSPAPPMITAPVHCSSGEGSDTASARTSAAARLSAAAPGHTVRVNGSGGRSARATVPRRGGGP